ncbi:MAG TPA: autotransporter [Baekduia sp.]|uniref:autotransporter n=1 Tax=Baekduia sp. TaxID=2600305 RepID=UPI002C53EBE8|nr:autotransporter [Baekduia sp.]HMJ36271.1 autotransporter [Baekduia sp.]
MTRIHEHVALKLLKRSGSSVFEHTGRATGTVAGSVRSRITLSHSVLLRGTVTISTSKGKLRLDVSGRARSIELRTKFDGTARIAGGSGRYADAHGSGTFTGVVNRSTWAATIDATGSFSY